MRDSTGGRRVTPPEGGSATRISALPQAVNVHILDGETFDGSPAVMVRAAIPTRRATPRPSMADLIRNDIREVRERGSSMTIIGNGAHRQPAPVAQLSARSNSPPRCVPRGLRAGGLRAGADVRDVLLHQRGFGELLDMHRPAFLASAHANETAGKASASRNRSSRRDPWMRSSCGRPSSRRRCCSHRSRW